MLAYADGKEIEYLCKDGWRVTTDAFFNWSNDANYYRIKPQSKYRPFKDAEECWQEMQKHQPFGWVKEISSKKCINLRWVPTEDDTDAFHDITFADGTPFGIMEESV